LNYAFIDLWLLPSTVDALYDVVLAKGACRVDVKPLIDAGTVKMVAAREFPQFHSVVISREADATFLHIQRRDFGGSKKRKKT